MSTERQYASFRATAATAIDTAARYAPSPLVTMVQLLLDVVDLSPAAVLRRLCLVLSNDVETNPGPHQPSSVFCAETSTDSFVYTDKSVRMSMADKTNIVVTYQCPFMIFLLACSLIVVF